MTSIFKEKKNKIKTNKITGHQIIPEVLIKTIHCVDKFLSLTKTGIWNRSLSLLTKSSNANHPRTCCFKKFLGGHMSFFRADTCPFLGPLVPLFWISVDISSGFQSQRGFCLIYFFARGKCNAHFLRSTSGDTHANLLMAGNIASYFPTYISRGGTWLGFKRAITQTHDECVTIVPATRLLSINMICKTTNER